MTISHGSSGCVKHKCAKAMTCLSSHMPIDEHVANDKNILIEDQTNFVKQCKCFVGFILMAMFLSADSSFLALKRTLKFSFYVKTEIKLAKQTKESHPVVLHFLATQSSMFFVFLWNTQSSCTALWHMKRLQQGWCVASSIEYIIAMLWKVCAQTYLKLICLGVCCQNFPKGSSLFLQEQLHDPSTFLITQFMVGVTV